MKRTLLLFSVLLLLMSNLSFGYISDCDFKIEKIDDSTYKSQVLDFDKLYGGENCFQGWLNDGSDKPDGILFIYDENGKKRVKALYNNGIRVGKHLKWYATGELEDETTWFEDKYFTSKGYYKSGKIKHTSENGNRPNAVYKDFYGNGQLKTLSDWSKTGDKRWFEDGQLNSFRDVRKSIYTEWYKDGTIKLTGKLEAFFVRTGSWKYYDESGKLTRELIYKDSTKAGLYFEESGWTEEKKY